MKVIFACALIFALVSNGTLSFTNKSCDTANAADDVVRSYEAAKAQLSQSKADYDAIIAQAQEINSQIEQTANLAMQEQAVLVKKQNQFNNIVKYEYINSTQFTLLASLLESDSISDFFKNMDYANSVMDYQSKLAYEQKQRKVDYDVILQNLQSQSAQQNDCLAAADKKVQEASALFESIRAQLTPAQLAELEGIILIGGDEPTPSPDPGPDPGPQPVPGTWSSGTASAYGGVTDPSTGAVSITATGEICDDSSTGCAVPMVWPGYRSYFHRYVLISWNGMTLTAKCNDCGYMGWGSRCLDLQPGIWRGFGFGSCNAWGLRWIEYQWL